MQVSVAWLSEYFFPMKYFERFLFLSSSPRAFVRKDKLRNAILWITLTAQSLVSQHCNMEQYSMNELTDKHLVYGAAYQSERRAARMYAERFPQRRHPAHNMSSELTNRSISFFDTWCGGSHSWFRGRWAVHQLTWNCTLCSVKPYSAKGLGDRLYAMLHKMPGEVGYSFCLFSKS